MDNSLTPDERRRFRVWRSSPSVFSSNVDELIIAFKFGLRLPYPASRVLKAMRGLDGLDPEMVRHIEELVHSDPSLVFTGEAPDRLVVITGPGEASRG